MWFCYPNGEKEGRLLQEKGVGVGQRAVGLGRLPACIHYYLPPTHPNHIEGGEEALLPDLHTGGQGHGDGGRKEGGGREGCTPHSACLVANSLEDWRLSGGKEEEPQTA